MNEKMFDTREEALTALRNSEVIATVDTDLERLFVCKDNKIIVLTDVAEDSEIVFNNFIEMCRFLAQLDDSYICS